jgi:hypothetical protein
MAGKGPVIDLTPEAFERISEATSSWDKAADESITDIQAALLSLRNSGDVEGGKGDAILEHIKAETTMLQEVREIKQNIKKIISARLEAVHKSIAGAVHITDKTEKVKGGTQKLKFN